MIRLSDFHISAIVIAVVHVLLSFSRNVIVHTTKSGFLHIGPAGVGTVFPQNNRSLPLCYSKSVSFSYRLSFSNFKQ